MTLKQKIYSHYLRLINEKINMLQLVLADLKESGANETKSTAGDKHETALAMLQIEQANKRTQLQEVLNQKAVLEKIDASLSPEIVVTGSLIRTNRGLFFMSVALGKLLVDNINTIALSPQSPLGQKLMHLRAGDSISFNNATYQIEGIE